MTDADELYRVRALTSDDTELLESIDAAYAARLGAEVTASRGSASFHARTGHSFVAERGEDPQGFVLASAIWTGGRPTVRMERLALAEDAGPAAGRALVAALVKSAYDAGVYDLLAELPASDGSGEAALLAADFRPAPVKLFRRTLGSRGQEPA